MKNPKYTAVVLLCTASHAHLAPEDLVYHWRWGQDDNVADAFALQLLDHGHQVGLELIQRHMQVATADPEGSSRMAGFRPWQNAV